MTIDLIRVNPINDNIEDVLGEYTPSAIIIDATYTPAIDIAWAVFACVKKSTNYTVIVNNTDVTEEINKLVEAIKGYYAEIYN